MALSPDDIARLRGLVADNTFTARFDLEREIGAGGMGRVFVATDKDSNKKIAIKLIEAAAHGDAVRFAKEADLLEQLAHPAIVAYVAHGVTADGRAYLAMTWLEGETVAERLERAPLALAEVVVIGTRVAGALAYLHERGVVHRDIKPSNVFLVNKDPAAATVIDLGIAKQLDATQKLTRTGQLIGTPGYMAPEQVMGESTIDGRVDMFALGCLLYEALSGKLPFPGDAVMEVLAHLLLHDPKPLDEVTPGVPPRLATLVAILLAKEANDRTIDAAATATELEAIREALAANDATALATSPFERPVLGNADTIEPTGATVLERPVGVAATVTANRRPPWLLVVGVFVVAAAVVIGVLVLVMRRTDKPAGTTRVAVPTAAPSERVVGPTLAGKVALDDTADRDQLASDILGATWCKPRERTIAVTEDLAVWAIGRDRSVGSIAKLDLVRERHEMPHVVCLDDGKILIAIGARGIAITGSTVSPPQVLPATVNGGISLGTTARWYAAGQLVDWSGGAVTEAASTCKKPLRLSPRGDRMLCTDSDNGEALDDLRDLPAGKSFSWSADGKALYFARGGEAYRWNLDEPIAKVTRVAAGASPVEVGEWIATVDHGYVLTSLRDPAKQQRIAADIIRQRVVATIPEHGELVVELGAGQGVRIVSAAHAELDMQETRHYDKIRALAFSADGKRIASLDESARLVTRTLAGTERRAVRLHGATAEYHRLGGIGPMYWIADGSFVWLGGGPLEVWSADGSVTERDFAGERGCSPPPCRSGAAGVVAGTDELVRANHDGIFRIGVDGKIGAQVIARQLARRVFDLEVDHARRYALVELGGQSSIASEVLDLATGATVLEVASPSDGMIQRQVLAMAADDRPAVIVRDSKYQVFLVDADGALPLFTVPESQHGAANDLAAAGKRVAVLAGHDVIVVDVELRKVIAVAPLDNEVTAIAWDRTGRMLAVAGVDTELRIFDVP